MGTISIEMLRSFSGELEKIAEVVPVVGTKKNLKNHLKPGDIFLTTISRRVKGKSPIGTAADAVYRVGTSRVQGKYTHAGMYVGDGKVVEVRGSMVTKPVEDSLKNLNAIVLRPNVSAKDRRTAASRMKTLAKKHKNDGYAKLPHMLKVVATEASPIKLPGRSASPNTKELICSNTIAEAYSGIADFTNGRKSRKYVIPKDFLRSRETTVVAKLKSARNEVGLFSRRPKRTSIRK